MNLAAYGWYGSLHGISLSDKCQDIVYSFYQRD